MKREERLLGRLPSVLASLLAVPESKVKLRLVSSPGRVDAVASVAGHRFAMELKALGTAGVVAAAASEIVSAREVARGAIPVVVVPFMLASGKTACEQAGVSWLDLSGNASIVAPGLRILVDGRPNLFPKRGRPASVFAPKSARVARWLLMNPSEAFVQRELSRAVGVSEGLVSRIIRRLEQEGYVGHDEGGGIKLTNPQLLLDAWQDDYDFSKHTVIRGHAAARAGDALTRAVAATLVMAKVEHAATGLSAAWQMTQYASFRIATFFLADEPDEVLRERLGFREDPRGANLWLVVPNDTGVFQGAQDRDGVRCVHPVQAYLDLRSHPERSAEAAKRLRDELLRW